MHEKRLTYRLISHWEKLPKAIDSDYPLVNSLNSAALSDIWQRCAQLSHENPAEHNLLYRLDYVGDELVAVFGKYSHDDKVNLNDPISPIADVLQNVSQILEDKKPILDDGHFINSKSQVVKYRSCVLPFTHKTALSHLVLGLSWREF